MFLKWWISHFVGACSVIPLLLPSVLRMKTHAWAPNRGGKCSGRSTRPPTPPPPSSPTPVTHHSALSAAEPQAEKKKKSLNRLAQEQECWSEDLFFRRSGKLLLNRIFFRPRFPHVGWPVRTKAWQLSDVTVRLKWHLLNDQAQKMAMAGSTKEWMLNASIEDGNMPC